MGKVRGLTVVGTLGLVAMSLAAVAGEGRAGFTNSIGIGLVRIEPGRFAMGQEKGGDWDERPVHEVTIGHPFLMGVTEVTNAQYERFDADHKRYRGERRLSVEDDEAVVFVSWHEAVAFCAWLSEREGKPYRLPTEAEWEYACRAGTTTAFHAGDELPEAFHKRQKTGSRPLRVSLAVGMTPANAWGLRDMHGNVEEWCRDWYGPYEEGGAENRDSPCSETREDSPRFPDFKVTRGGSHNTEVQYLRSANRMGTLPEDKHWLIGFRVVQGEPPETAPLPHSAPPLWAQDVNQTRCGENRDSPCSETREDSPRFPYFEGPIPYVKIPPRSVGPMFSAHNHCPAIAACPNGDLLAIWYSTIREPGRELAIVAARLRRGNDEWDAAAPFWDAPDRNDHASDVWWDGENTLFHFNGLGTDGTWAKLALILRRSTDNGQTWSKARLIDPEHRLRNMPIAGLIQTARGDLVLPCDAVTGGSGGSAVNISADGGRTWVDPGEGERPPKFEAGETGPWIAGIHAGVVELADGRLMAFGRGDDIDDRMPMSVSADAGRTWTYSTSEFPPIGGGQRLAVLRLREGPILFVSFTDTSGNRGESAGITIRDAAGVDRHVYGMFATLSLDDGETWPVKRLITPGGQARDMNGGGNTGPFVMDATHAEPRGYLAATQTPDGVIHLISSLQHYRFNLAWLEAPMPAGE